METLNEVNTISNRDFVNGNEFLYVKTKSAATEEVDLLITFN